MTIFRMPLGGLHIAKCLWLFYQILVQIIIFISTFQVYDVHRISTSVNDAVNRCGLLGMLVDLDWGGLQN